MTLSCLILLFVFSFTVVVPFCASNPLISESGLICGAAKEPASTIFISTFVEEMHALAQTIDNQNWAYHSTPGASGSNHAMYGLAQCFDDLSHTDCLLCFAASRTKLPRCLPALSARIYLDGCFLRYDNYRFYEEYVDPVLDRANCTTGYGVVVHQVQEFEKSVSMVVEKVTRIALANGGFGVGSVLGGGGVEGVYAMAQCWRTVGGAGCKACLRKAGEEVKGCAASREGRAMNAGCYLRYSTQKFYNHDEQTLSDQKSEKTGVITAVLLAAAAAFMFLVFATYLGYLRLRVFKQEQQVSQYTSSISKMNMKSNRKKFNLKFKYETLEKATNFFDPSRKLGQGGAGIVFKAILPDGRIAAVKRLFFNTRHWADEFFNEVNLISGIQHRNLIKLIGCSIEGPESLLVYEYVPNKSLDHYIFGKEEGQNLNWKQRFDIIVGTAEGLAHLHGGTQTRILHRDIKSSNVLLDEDFKPKIADFGLVRCFGADKTHLSTGIAGTLGYMAPEYLLRGQLTDKADVYSYGVLVLEIVSGRKNILLLQNSVSILQSVWNSYRINRLCEAVDPRLSKDFSEAEAERVLQIGLLCIQALASLRPSMAQVVQMLTDESCAIPSPNQPPFLNTNLLESTDWKVEKTNQAGVVEIQIEHRYEH
ncbi:Cysteine-rich receptor-like protein [Drosera capensis]